MPQAVVQELLDGNSPVTLDYTVTQLHATGLFLFSRGAEINSWLPWYTSNLPSSYHTQFPSASKNRTLVFDCLVQPGVFGGTTDVQETGVRAGRATLGVHQT